MRINIYLISYLIRKFCDLIVLIDLHEIMTTVCDLYSLTMKSLIEKGAKNEVSDTVTYAKAI